MENIRDYILPTTVEKSESRGKARRPAGTEYSIVFASGPDFAIRRKTKLASRVLVFLVSQSQYYFKDEKTGEIVQFSPSEYARFMADAPDGFKLIGENGESCNWLKALSRGKLFGETLERISRRFSRDENARLAATRNWLSIDHVTNYRGNTIAENIKPNESIVKKVLSVCMEYVPEETVKEAYTKLAFCGYCLGDKVGSAIDSLLRRHNYGYHSANDRDQKPGCSADLLVDAYGLSGMEETIREYFQVGVNKFPSFQALFALFNITDETRNDGHLRVSISNMLAAQVKRKFNLRDFKHYLWYQSVYQGYADEIDNFMHSWADSLRMQEMIYGRIKEKYPENLASCEKKLSYKFSQIKQEIDEKKWAAMVKCMELLEYKGRTYSIICPKTAADVLDEAQQQSNCVASYVSKIINGECMILFCRRTDAPEVSLITVEITADGRLGQVKARFNRAPDPEVREFVDSWYNKIVLTSGLWPQAA